MPAIEIFITPINTASPIFQAALQLTATQSSPIALWAPLRPWDSIDRIVASSTES